MQLKRSNPNHSATPRPLILLAHLPMPCAKPKALATAPPTGRFHLQHSLLLSVWHPRADQTMMPIASGTSAARGSGSSSWCKSQRWLPCCYGPCAEGGRPSDSSRQHVPSLAERDAARVAELAAEDKHAAARAALEAEIREEVSKRLDAANAERERRERWRPWSRVWPQSWRRWRWLRGGSSGGHTNRDGGIGGFSSTGASLS